MTDDGFAGSAPVSTPFWPAKAGKLENYVSTSLLQPEFFMLLSCHQPGILVQNLGSELSHLERKELTLDFHDQGQIYTKQAKQDTRHLLSWPWGWQGWWALVSVTMLVAAWVAASFPGRGSSRMSRLVLHGGSASIQPKCASAEFSMKLWALYLFFWLDTLLLKEATVDSVEFL